MAKTRRSPRPDVKPSLQGDLTIVRAAELQQACLAFLNAPGPTLLVDASGIEDVDCAGLQLLLALRAAATAAGRQLRLERPSATLQDACNALGLQALLSEEVSLEATL